MRSAARDGKGREAMLMIAAGMVLTGAAAMVCRPAFAADSPSYQEREVMPSPPIPGAQANGPGKEEAGAIKPARIQTGSGEGFGTYLADETGRGVYVFKSDTQGKSGKDAKSDCYDECALDWPPVLTKGAPKATGAVKKDLLGTMKRRNGNMQVTYNGWPLYLYVADASPGGPRGQDLSQYGAKWHLIRPDGSLVRKERKSPETF